jgi:hypothetical protein
MTENPGHRSYDELFIGGQWRKPANPQQLAVIPRTPKSPSATRSWPAPTMSMQQWLPRGRPSTAARGRG